MTVSEEKQAESEAYAETLVSSQSIHNSVQVLNEKEEENVGMPSVKEEKKERKKELFTIFTTRKLIFFLAIVSLTGMISPLIASIYLPAVNSIEFVSGSRSLLT
jgi:hypothetical protein